MPSDYKAITKYNEEQLGRDTASRKTQISMYSDATHFVYEILQNADDYGAKEVFFKLSETELWIEHDGEPFIEDNVKAITYFGQSTSREDFVKTGRFGVGFKSVFAFTATPIIISGCEHFQIYGLYRVKEHLYPDDLPRSRTRIILPFNHESENPDYVENLMSRADAYSKIEERLTSLNKNTLLFTRNIREIRWETNDRSGHYLREDDISDSARMTTITDGEHLKKYLVFSREPIWEGKVHKAVDVAFGIDEKGAIVPAEEDFLYVLFATTQETHLKFILNGPYRTNPARETISEDDPFNEYLLKETCDLVKEVLPQIRKRNLLTTEFLAVLPNQDDDLRNFYEPIIDRMVEEFNNEQLIPMKQGSHAPAMDVFTGPAQLSDLIDDKDLARILGKKYSPPLWIANPSQRNRRARNFLSMLEIKEWNTTDLIDKLSAKSDTIMKWLKKKTYDWHQRLYVLLLDEFPESIPSYLSYRYDIERDRRDKLLNLRIVRCSDKIYRKGRDCFFPSDGVEHDEAMPRVAKKLYSSGKDKDQQDKARKFLEKIEVREVGEEERIEAILRNKYLLFRYGSNEEFSSKIKDLKRFINFVEQHPEQADMFKHYSIFKLTNGKWGKPSEVYLDSPFYATGLSIYYEVLGYKAQYCGLSEDYKNCGISAEKIGKFAKAVGAQNQLCVKEQSIPWDHPLQRYSDRTTSYEKGIDYDISEFGVLLNDSDLRKSQLIWDTMNRLSGDYLEARYRPNKSTPYRTGESTLVRRLREEEWVPQIENGIDGIESFVKPSEATAKLLPKGFLSEAKAQWLEAVEFGKNKRDRETRERLEKERATQEYQHKEGVLKSVGFSSVEQAQKLARLNKENPGMIDELIRRQEAEKQRPAFPEKTSNNPDRRQEKVKEQLADTSDKEYEELKRSVRTSRGTVVPKIDLREQYTNDSGEMVCQICKEEMPFKKRDGEYYFEAVEALSGAYFPKEYEAQPIALCPLCAAMYKEFVIRDEDAMKELHRALKDSDDLEVPLKLGELETSIQFVETHRLDVKTVLQNSV